MRDVVDFGKYRISGKPHFGGPNLDDVVSTLVARALPDAFEDAPKYWLRRVRVITLAEALDNYKDDEDFKVIYEAWLEGQVVIRKRKMRGTAGGSRR